jgi:hypothetical protein
MKPREFAVAFSILATSACAFAATDGIPCEDGCVMRPCIPEAPATEIDTFAPFSLDDVERLTPSVVLALGRMVDDLVCAEPLSCPRPDVSTTAATTCRFESSGPVWTLSYACSAVALDVAIRQFTRTDPPRDMTVAMQADDQGRVVSLVAEHSDGTWVRRFDFTYRDPTGFTPASLVLDAHVLDEVSQVWRTEVSFDGDGRAVHARRENAAAGMATESFVEYAVVDGIARATRHSLDTDGDQVIDERQHFLYDDSRITDVRVVRAGLEPLTMPVGDCCRDDCGGQNVTLTPPVAAR